MTAKPISELLEDYDTKPKIKFIERAFLIVDTFVVLLFFALKLL